jgi:hypothetical protein
MNRYDPAVHHQTAIHDSVLAGMLHDLHSLTLDELWQRMPAEYANVAGFAAVAAHQIENEEGKPAADAFKRGIGMMVAAHHAERSYAQLQRLLAQ